MSTEIFPAFTVRLTAAELVVIGALQDLRFPEYVDVWISSGEVAESESHRAARTEEAALALFARNIVDVAGDDAFISAPIAAVLRVICEPDWEMQSTVLSNDISGFDFWLSGAKNAGVLATDGGFGCISFSYDPQVAQRIPQLLAALVARERCDVTTKPSSNERFPIREFAGRDGWSRRVMRSVSCRQSGREGLSEVVWLRCASDLFLVTGSVDGLLGQAIAEEDLVSELATIRRLMGRGFA